MARFFFHVHHGVDLPDEEGTELPDLAAARREAIRLAGALLAETPDTVWNSGLWKLEIKDETGVVLAVLEFTGRHTGAPS